MNVSVLSALILGPASAAALSVIWDSDSTPYPGVRLREGHTDSPSRHFFAAFVDLCADQVHVTATAPPSARRTTGAWAADQGVQLATNGDFFAYEIPPTVYGDAVGGGERWSAALTGVDDSGAWYFEDYGWIAFGPGWVEFSHSGHVKRNAEAFRAAGYSVSQGWSPDAFTTEIPASTLALVSGFPALVIEGKLYTCPDPRPAGGCFPERSDMSSAHLRTAMGITEDRQTFILVVVTSSTYGEELAEIMYELGAWQAFNVDGGGSSTMWLENGGYLHPTGTVRAVANHWGIFAGAAGGQPQEPGHCFVAGGCYPTAVAGAESSDFKDLPPGWVGYAEASILARAGLTSGCRQQPAPMFCPRCPTTRREMAVFMARAAGLDTSSPPATPSFDDVPSGDWGYASIEACVTAGIVSTANSSFRPDSDATRGQAAAFITRATGWPTERPAAASFSDVPTDHVFFGAVETLKAYCVTSGCGDGSSYCPDDPITRAQTAVFIARAWDLEDANSCWDPIRPDASLPDTASPDAALSDTAPPDTAQLDRASSDVSALDRASADVGQLDALRADRVSLDLPRLDLASADLRPFFVDGGDGDDDDPRVRSGCACSGADVSPTLAVIALALLILRRRGSRA